MSQQNRNTLRQQMRARRRALTFAQQLQAAEGLLHQLQQLSLWNNAQHIALYMSCDGEIGTFDLIHQLWREEKQVYLPVVDEQWMHFVLFTPDTPLEGNRFNVPEPLGVPVSSDTLDLICVPLTAFDAQGHRLGMGGGFYDRCFAHHDASTKPQLIGLAHDFQQVDCIETQMWDVPLMGIVTDRDFYPAALAD